MQISLLNGPGCLPIEIQHINSLATPATITGREEADQNVNDHHVAFLEPLFSGLVPVPRLEKSATSHTVGLYT